MRRVPYTQPDATLEEKTDETTTIKVRPLFVDDRQKDWTTGEAHDITDRTFAIRHALHINDALPTDAVPHWIWQPGPWITVDRLTGHITRSTFPTSTPSSRTPSGSATTPPTAAPQTQPRGAASTSSSRSSEPAAP